MQGGRFDGINTGMFWTEERSKIAYTVPYAQQTIAPPSTGHRRQAHRRGIAGRPQGGRRGQLYQERWLRGVDKEQVAKGAKPIEILTFKTATEVLAALRAGQVETAILIDADGRGDQAPRPDRDHRNRPRQRADRTQMYRNKNVAEKVAGALTEAQEGRLLRQAVRQVRSHQTAGRDLRHPRRRGPRGSGAARANAGASTSGTSMRR